MNVSSRNEALSLGRITEPGLSPRTFPGGTLKVINRNRFRAGPISGSTLEDFLLED